MDEKAAAVVGAEPIREAIIPQTIRNADMKLDKLRLDKEKSMREAFEKLKGDPQNFEESSEDDRSDDCLESLSGDISNGATIAVTSLITAPPSTTSNTVVSEVLDSSYLPLNPAKSLPSNALEPAETSNITSPLPAASAAAIPTDEFSLVSTALAPFSSSASLPAVLDVITPINSPAPLASSTDSAIRGPLSTAHGTIVDFAPNNSNRQTDASVISGEDFAAAPVDGAPARVGKGNAAGAVKESHRRVSRRALELSLQLKDEEIVTLRETLADLRLEAVTAHEQLRLRERGAEEQVRRLLALKEETDARLAEAVQDRDNEATELRAQVVALEDLMRKKEAAAVAASHDADIDANVLREAKTRASVAEERAIAATARSESAAAEVRLLQERLASQAVELQEAQHEAAIAAEASRTAAFEAEDRLRELVRVREQLAAYRAEASTVLKRKDATIKAMRERMDFADSVANIAADGGAVDNKGALDSEVTISREAGGLDERVTRREVALDRRLRRENETLLEQVGVLQDQLDAAARTAAADIARLEAGLMEATMGARAAREKELAESARVASLSREVTDALEDLERVRQGL